MFYAISLNMKEIEMRKFYDGINFLRAIIHVIGKFLKVLVNLFLNQKFKRRTSDCKLVKSE